MDDSNYDDSKFNVEDLYRESNDCQNALHTLYHYLDGELTEERRSAIQRHLSECHSCLDAFDFEAELKSVVGRSCRDQVPDELRRKIAEALTEASKREPGPV